MDIITRIELIPIIRDISGLEDRWLRLCKKFTDRYADAIANADPELIDMVLIDTICSARKARIGPSQIFLHTETWLRFSCSECDESTRVHSYEFSTMNKTIGLIEIEV